MAVVVGVVLSLVAGELFLRLFLFHPTLEMGGLGASIRRPELYSAGDNEDDYWKLRTSFQDPVSIIDAPGADPITGWTGSYITAGTYEHANEALIKGRKLILLYGDSFSQCNTPVEECFQSILEQSELGSQYILLNYGVGGYGLDQIYLLLKHSIDRFTALDPIVIVGMLPESDLDRTTLSYRDWPKPRLEVVGNRVVARAPVHTNAREYLERNPVSIRSFLWRFFLHHQALFLAERRAGWRLDLKLQAEKQLLNRQILIAIEDELSKRHLQHFYLLFHAEQGALRTWDAFAWQEKLVHDVCTELSIPLVDTRPFLAFASDDKPQKCAQFYGHSGPLNAHHNSVGNVVCFEAIRQGLRGEFRAPDMQHLASMKRHGLFDAGVESLMLMRLVGRESAVIGHGTKDKIRVLESTSPRRLLLRADVGGSTKASFDLAGASKRFTGQLHTMRNPEQGCDGVALGLTVVLDGKIVLEYAVPKIADALPIDLDLADKASLAFVVTGFGGESGCDWVCIEDPRFE